MSAPLPWEAGKPLSKMNKFELRARLEWVRDISKGLAKTFAGYAQQWPEDTWWAGLSQGYSTVVRMIERGSLEDELERKEREAKETHT